MKTSLFYKGTRTENGAEVVKIVDGVEYPLDLRLDIHNHSPTGFEWGYSGSGPAQLALAILADYLKDDNKAQNLHQHFKADVIAGLNTNWEINEHDIKEWLSHV